MLGILGKADQREFDSLFLALETNMPQGVAFQRIRDLPS